MTGLVLANIYAPGRRHHGTTVVIDEADPCGAVAYARAVCRYADDIGPRHQLRNEGVTALCSCGARTVLVHDVGGRS